MVVSLWEELWQEVVDLVSGSFCLCVAASLIRTASCLVPACSIHNCPWFGFDVDCSSLTWRFAVVAELRLVHWYSGSDRLRCWRRP